ESVIHGSRVPGWFCWWEVRGSNPTNHLTRTAGPRASGSGLAPRPSVYPQTPMPLTNGTRFGPYEILSPIGAGGMGEVYKARDTRLDRIVAIKILAQRHTSSADAKLRFQREAKTIAGLNHAHICTLHDVGHQD